MSAVEYATAGRAGPFPPRWVKRSGFPPSEAAERAGWIAVNIAEDRALSSSATASAGPGTAQARLRLLALKARALDALAG